MHRISAAALFLIAFLGCAWSAGAATGKSSELIGASSFGLVWNGDKLVTFKDVSGLESETEVREQQQTTKGGKPIIIKSQGATVGEGREDHRQIRGFQGRPHPQVAARSRRRPHGHGAPQRLHRRLRRRQEGS